MKRRLLARSAHLLVFTALLFVIGVGQLLIGHRETAFWAFIGAAVFGILSVVATYIPSDDRADE